MPSLDLSSSLKELSQRMILWLQLQRERWPDQRDGPAMRALMREGWDVVLPGGQLLWGMLYTNTVLGEVVLGEVPGPESPDTIERAVRDGLIRAAQPDVLEWLQTAP